MPLGTQAVRYRSRSISILNPRHHFGEPNDNPLCSLETTAVPPVWDFFTSQIYPEDQAVRLSPASSLPQHPEKGIDLLGFSNL